MKALNRIKLIFKRAFNADIEFDEHTMLRDIKQWDSVSHLNLVIEIEEEFGISLSMDQIESLDSVDAIIKAVSRDGN